MTPSQPQLRCPRGSPRVYVAVATGLFLAGTATHFALRSEAAPPVEVAAAQVFDPGAAWFPANWWASDEAVCPTGTEPRGAAPPDGLEAWCVRPDGTREGWHVGWHANGRQAFQRSYHDGVLHGPFSEWFASGQLFRQGENRAGVRHGRFTRWAPSGEVAEIVTYDDRGVETGRSRP